MQKLPYLLGSSLYVAGTSKYESGISSLKANSWNVIFAETVGRIGISAREKEKNAHYKHESQNMGHFFTSVIIRMLCTLHNKLLYTNA